MPALQRLRAILGCILVTCAFASPTAAAVFTVGGDGACTHGSVQSAINSAEISLGADTIRVSRSMAYSAQALTVSTEQILEIEGGYADCAAVEDTTATTLSGAGGATDPVLTITALAGSIVRVRRLTISGGDQDGTGYGGGIFFQGNGKLEISQATISNNLAGYGGGIYALATGDSAELVIGNNVSILSNTARYSGGGIYVEGLEMTMTAPGSILAFNEALGTGGEGGFGGGLMILGGPFTAAAYVGSSGVGELGAVYSNEARHGGGMAVVGEPDGVRDAFLYLFTTDAARPMAIRGNFASATGGAIYARADADSFPDIVESRALVVMWNTSLVDNAAPEGAAVHLDYDTAGGRTSGAFMSVNWPSISEIHQNRGLPCPDQAPCGSISGNVTVTAGGDPTNGAILRGGHATTLLLFNSAAQDNQGGSVIHLDDSAEFPGFVGLRNALLAGNTTTGELLRTTGDAPSLSIDSTTIAGNSIGASQVLAVAGPLDLRSSILWQPGLQTTHAGAQTEVEYVIASEVASIGGGPAAVVATPRFVDPVRGDFELRAASHAVDYAPSTSEDDRDLYNRPRDRDLFVKANVFGYRDLGALERPQLQPLVLNAGIDTDLNQWSVATPGAATWSPDDRNGQPDSGSVLVSMNPAPSASVSALTQCIHLPGPAGYALNGYGKAVGFTVTTRDALYLKWEFRSDGGENCTDGPADDTGNHFLTSSSSWSSPAVPAYIVVGESAWTHNSSITITLLVVDKGVTAPIAVAGYFDDIRLEFASSPLGELFKDGFEG